MFFIRTAPLYFILHHHHWAACTSDSRGYVELLAETLSIRKDSFTRFNSLMEALVIRNISHLRNCFMNILGINLWYLCMYKTHSKDL